MKQPGRNDPCHCHSGKKYKKCHLAADEKASHLENQKRKDALTTSNEDEKTGSDTKKVASPSKTFSKKQNQNVQNFRLPRRSNG